MTDPRGTPGPADRGATDHGATGPAPTGPAPTGPVPARPRSTGLASPLVGAALLLAALVAGGVLLDARQAERVAGLEARLAEAAAARAVLADETARIAAAQAAIEEALALAATARQAGRDLALAILRHRRGPRMGDPAEVPARAAAFAAAWSAWEAGVRPRAARIAARLGARNQADSVAAALPVGVGRPLRAAERCLLSALDGGPGRWGCEVHGGVEGLLHLLGDQRGCEDAARAMLTEAVAVGRGDRGRYAAVMETCTGTDPEGSDG